METAVRAASRLLELKLFPARAHPAHASARNSGVQLLFIHAAGEVTSMAWPARWAMIAIIAPSPYFSYTTAKNCGAYTIFALPELVIIIALGAVALRNIAIVGQFGEQADAKAAFTWRASCMASPDGL